MGASPTNIRPYRHPYIQKSEIEQLGRKMEEFRIIQNRTSPFSSPVLLVKKNDTWQFFVDYRGRNALTIKDKFPIPVIVELLDELNGVTIFSNLDLRWVIIKFT